MFYEDLSFFKRVWPAFAMTAVFSLLFGSLYYFPSSQALKIVGAIFLAITLWLGFIYIINEAKHSFPRPIRRVIRWLHAMSFEFIIVILAHGVCRPIMRLLGKPFKSGNPNGVPILLIHGYLCDWTGWAYVKWKLARANLGPIYSIDLHNVLASIEDYAKEIGQVAEKIQKETGRKELILIGHSMGGLVACTYASQIAPPGTVKTVVTIGSPLGGTPMAHLGLIGKSAKEMLPDSDFVKKVHESIEKHPEITLYQVMSQTDELIIPSTAAYADARSDRHYAVGDIGHMTLLFSSRIANRMIYWLKEYAFLR